MLIMNFKEMRSTSVGILFHRKWRRRRRKLKVKFKQRDDGTSNWMDVTNYFFIACAPSESGQSKQPAAIIFHSNNDDDGDYVSEGMNFEEIVFTETTATFRSSPSIATQSCLTIECRPTSRLHHQDDYHYTRYGLKIHASIHCMVAAVISVSVSAAVILLSSSSPLPLSELNYHNNKVIIRAPPVGSGARRRAIPEPAAGTETNQVNYADLKSWMIIKKFASPLLSKPKPKAKVESRAIECCCWLIKPKRELEKGTHLPHHYRCYHTLKRRKLDDRSGARSGIIHGSNKLIAVASLNSFKKSSKDKYNGLERPCLSNELDEGSSFVEIEVTTVTTSAATKQNPKRDKLIECREFEWDEAQLGLASRFLLEKGASTVISGSGNNNKLPTSLEPLLKSNLQLSGLKLITLVVSPAKASWRNRPILKLPITARAVCHEEPRKLLEANKLVNDDEEEFIKCTCTSNNDHHVRGSIKSSLPVHSRWLPSEVFDGPEIEIIPKNQMAIDQLLAKTMSLPMARHSFICRSFTLHWNQLLSQAEIVVGLVHQAGACFCGIKSFSGSNKRLTNLPRQSIIVPAEWIRDERRQAEDGAKFKVEGPMAFEAACSGERHSSSAARVCSKPKTFEATRDEGKLKSDSSSMVGRLILLLATMIPVADTRRLSNFHFGHSSKSKSAGRKPSFLGLSAASMTSRTATMAGLMLALAPPTCYTIIIITVIAAICIDYIDNQMGPPLMIDSPCRGNIQTLIPFMALPAGLLLAEHVARKRQQRRVQDDNALLSPPLRLLDYDRMEHWILSICIGDSRKICAVCELIANLFITATTTSSNIIRYYISCACSSLVDENAPAHYSNDDDDTERLAGQHEGGVSAGEQCSSPYASVIGRLSAQELITGSESGNKTCIGRLTKVGGPARPHSPLSGSNHLERTTESDIIHPRLAAGIEAGRPLENYGDRCYDSDAGGQGTGGRRTTWQSRRSTRRLKFNLATFQLLASLLLVFMTFEAQRQGRGGSLKVSAFSLEKAQITTTSSHSARSREPATSSLEPSIIDGDAGWSSFLQDFGQRQRRVEAPRDMARIRQRRRGHWPNDDVLDAQAASSLAEGSSGSNNDADDNNDNRINSSRAACNISTTTANGQRAKLERRRRQQLECHSFNHNNDNNDFDLQVELPASLNDEADKINVSYNTSNERLSMVPEDVTNNSLLSEIERIKARLQGARKAPTMIQDRAPSDSLDRKKMTIARRCREYLPGLTSATVEAATPLEGPNSGHEQLNSVAIVALDDDDDDNTIGIGRAGSEDGLLLMKTWADQLVRQPASWRARRSAEIKYKLSAADRHQKGNQQQQHHHFSKHLLGKSGQQQQSNQPSSPITMLCPNDVCSCVWKNGKQFADCSATHKLNSIPSGLDPLLQVLNLSTNPLIELKREAFVSMNLNNLQRIYLSNCQLEMVDEKAFDKMKLVVELDFSWNKLKSIPLFQSKQLTLLRRLIMRGNPLFVLDERTLANKQSPPNKPPSSNATLSLMLRFVETYPDLAKYLLQIKLGYKFSGSDNMIIKTANSPSSGDHDDSEYELLQQVYNQLMENSNNFDGIDQVSNLDSLIEAPQPMQNAIVPADQDWSELKLGKLFLHLQELDFGQCQLRYIKWTVLSNLSQLKRLLLDGNQLSQLSGQLVNSLPSNLHQLSLEENPLHCDCRALTLKHWLLATRTPLSSRVRCAMDSPSSDGIEFGEASGGKETMSKQDKSRLVVIEQQQRQPSRQGQRHLDELNLEDFVCSPQAIFQLATSFIKPKSSLGDQTAPAPSEASLMNKLKLSAVLLYLEPTLLPSDLELEPANNDSLFDYDKRRFKGKASSDVAASRGRNKINNTNRHKELIQANEDDLVVLTCSILVMPESSLDIIWLVNYNKQLGTKSQVAANPGKVPVEERFVVAYDSRLHHYSSDLLSNSSKPPDNQQEQQQNDWLETSLYGSRLLIRESRSFNSFGIIKESQFIIHSAHIDDSARYKCIAMNNAGNSSFEYFLKIDASLQSTTQNLRDQRANDNSSSSNQQQVPITNRSPLEPNKDLQRTHKPSLAGQQPQQPVQQPSNGVSMNPAGTWLKSSATFQITIVIVSILMASVIIAFLLFCIVIYQIKPTGTNYSVSSNVLNKPRELASRQSSNTLANEAFGFDQQFRAAQHTDTSRVMITADLNHNNSYPVFSSICDMFSPKPCILATVNEPLGIKAVPIPGYQHQMYTTVPFQQQQQQQQQQATFLASSNLDDRYNGATSSTTSFSSPQQ